MVNSDAIETKARNREHAYCIFKIQIRALEWNLMNKKVRLNYLATPDTAMGCFPHFVN